MYSGDAGLLALGVHPAIHGDRTLGPYSRFGFFHPGPALYYVLAPFDWTTGGAPWALAFGVAVLNACVAGGLVVLVQRSATDSKRGALMGLAAAAVILGYSLAVDIGLLSILWNPLQILLPTALMLVAVAFVDGWGWPLAVVAAASTFVVQTHISTLPVAIVSVGLAGLFLARGQWRRAPSSWWPMALIGAALLAWIPPLVQQVSSRDGNFTAMWEFSRSSLYARPGWARAVSYAGRELAVVPTRMPWRGSLNPATVHGLRGVSDFAGFSACSVLLIALAAARRNSRASRLGVISLVAAFSAIYAVAQVRGDVGWYLTAYITATVVPLTFGWLLFGLDLFPRWGPRLIIIGLSGLVVAATSVASTTSIYDNRAFPTEQRYRDDTLAAWRILRPQLHDLRGRTIVIGGDTALLPTIAGVALKLTDAGIGIRVPDPLVSTFGPERRAPHDAKPDVLLTTTPAKGYKTLDSTPSQSSPARRIFVSTTVP